MPIYLINPLSPEAPKLAESIDHNFAAKDRYALPFNKGWFVHFPGTTVEVSNHIGISKADANEPSDTEPALVTMVPSYYGRAPTDVWEWLYTRMDK